MAKIISNKKMIQEERYKDNKREHLDFDNILR